MHVLPISPSTVMEGGLCRLVEADKIYTVPSLESLQQPAGAIEDSIQDVLEAASQILVPLHQYDMWYSQVGKIYQKVWKVRSFSSLSFRVWLLFTAEIHCLPVAKWPHYSRDLNHSEGLELLNSNLLSLLAVPSRLAQCIKMRLYLHICTRPSSVQPGGTSFLCT